MKKPAAANGSRPPLPSERPASRYTGIGDRANRRATAPNTASVARRAPSWNSSAPETCTSSALFDDLLNRGDAFFGADDDQDVALAQRLGRAGRGQDVLVAHDRDDRRAGAGAGPSVRQRPVHERAARFDVDLARLEARHFAGQLGEAFGDPRRAQDLGDGVGLLVGEAQERPGLIG